MHVAQRLLARGERVVGIDTVNDYYDVTLKQARIARLTRHPAMRFLVGDVADHEAVQRIAAEHDVDRVVHLAAQAGVRYSLENPFAYERANLLGHLSILELCRHRPEISSLVYASSSSVYGVRPLEGDGFREDDSAVKPASLYAATKRSGEMLSESYSHLYGLKQSGLRFFTVYGPWGRPDMAYFSFTRDILADRPIQVFGEGAMARDFTYIDDIVDGILGVLDRPPAAGVNRLLKIGNDRPEPLLDFVSILERATGREAVKIMKPMQAGDVTETWADIGRIRALTGYAPRTRLSEGLPRFVAWYRERYGA
jgi:UDP-glucuronate 4-epimerase